jgi:hypothetical protein
MQVFAGWATDTKGDDAPYFAVQKLTKETFVNIHNNKSPYKLSEVYEFAGLILNTFKIISSWLVIEYVQRDVAF